MAINVAGMDILGSDETPQDYGRWLDKFEINSATECWEWTAYRNPRGYGKVRHEGEPRLAHRVVYEALVEPIPEGLELDHLCRNPACVNPDHLEPVTHAENMRRSDAAKNGLAGLQQERRSKTHCPQGHPYSGSNLIIKKTGARACRACNNADSLRRYYEKKGVK